MANAIHSFDFLDCFDTPAALIDVNGVVLKTNNILKAEKQFSGFMESKSYLPESNDTKEWLSNINACLSKGSAEFALKAMNQNCKMTRLTNSNNKIILISFSDIAVSKLAEVQTFNSSNIQLPQSNPLQKEFTELGSCVAHAINNPLTVIATRTQMMQHSYQTKKPVTEEMVTQFLGKVEAQSERIKNIVEILRSLVKYPGVEEYNEININELIGDAYAAVLPQLQEKKIEYNFHGLENKWVKVKSAEIVQIFTALFVNSIEAFEVGKTESARIEIRFEEDDKNFHFYYTDNGPGIKDENYSKIFKPFFTTKTNNGATSGVGLSIGRKFARSYGGDLLNDSAEKGNCCFHLILPREVIEIKSKTQAA